MLCAYPAHGCEDNKTQRRTENIDAITNPKYRRKALRLYTVRGNNMRRNTTGKLFTRRLKCLPTAQITGGNIFKSFEKVVTPHLES